MSNVMEYKGYHAKVEYDPNDNILVGKVIGIADSLNFHAQSTNELVSTFHQSIENYLELCKKIGKSPDKEYSGTFNVRIPSELHKRAFIKAQQEGITLNKVVESALYAYLFPETTIMSEFTEQVAAFADSIKNLSSSISLTTKSEVNGNVSATAGGKATNLEKSFSKRENCIYLPPANSFNISKVQSALS